MSEPKIRAEMEQLKLWKQLEEWNKECVWVEKVNLDNSIFAAHAYTTVGQYGTRVDAPKMIVPCVSLTRKTPVVQIRITC